MRSSLIAAAACLLGLAACSSSGGAQADATIVSIGAPGEAPSEGQSSQPNGAVLPVLGEDPVPIVSAPPGDTSAGPATSPTEGSANPGSTPTTSGPPTSNTPTTPGSTTPGPTSPGPTSPDGVPAVPSDFQIDNRAPVPELAKEEPEEGVVRNGDGNLVTLDEAGVLACAAAEVALSDLDEGVDTSTAVDLLTSWGAQTSRTALRDAIAAISEPFSFSGLLPVLEVCVAEGHEL